MTQLITLGLVLLLVIDRLVYYASRPKKDLLTVWHSFWYYIRFWKPIRRSIRTYFLQRYPEISNDLDASWARKAFYTIHDTEGKLKIHRSASEIFWRTQETWTENDKTIINEYERLNSFWDKEKFKFKLKWLQVNHPKYYWLHKLKII